MKGEIYLNFSTKFLFLSESVKSSRRKRKKIKEITIFVWCFISFQYTLWLFIVLMCQWGYGITTMIYFLRKYFTFFYYYCYFSFLLTSCAKVSHGSASLSDALSAVTMWVYSWSVDDRVCRGFLLFSQWKRLVNIAVSQKNARDDLQPMKYTLKLYNAGGLCFFTDLLLCHWGNGKFCYWLKRERLSFLCETQKSCYNYSPSFTFITFSIFVSL